MKEKISEKDVGAIEDMITTLINLIHGEWHSIKSYFETGNDDWLKIANECRKDRSYLLEKITQKGDGELWCWNKHLLTVIGGLIELGNREYFKKNISESKKYFNDAKKWIGVFLIKNKIGG